MKKRVLGFCVLAMLALNVLPARAQAPDGGKPVVYTYVIDWTVPRELWRDYAKATEGEGEPLDKLVADGTLILYGKFEILFHTENEPTHGVWFSSPSRAGLLKAVAALAKRPQANFPVFAASKRRDMVTVSRMHGEKSGRIQNGYMAGAVLSVKAGQQSTFDEILRKHHHPIMEKLLAEGALNMYSVEVEDFHTTSPDRVIFIYSSATGEGIDKVQDALRSALSKDPALEAAFRNTIDWSRHFDFLTNIPEMVNK